jgi:hypothetical protein
MWDRVARSWRRGAYAAVDSRFRGNDGCGAAQMAVVLRRVHNVYAANQGAEVATAQYELRRTSLSIPATLRPGGEAMPRPLDRLLVCVLS